ncbi:hypothetical protein PUNSTDRAFT_47894 [Punctularia strigosozonata HHB-11173 SS5]|uniref:gamma-glutamylcyclotransferase n=1 Tax=Punctularia strigosozonata (strain HHB-11173) TaxID=741275 RepID=R7S3U7_PUNST|nr:uncharacterized protein PUNSTDRAFT_47894 [Punctularia strigosozonata HHB-11173 SS5]EIN03906.1 hypothetical protein PUNSTDRAFT_47894 [Punctularia strigosozonata HHB-11173 SS5]
MNPPLPSTLYFAYGSNLWLEQMALRCPNSPYVGMAVLRDWRWIINERGYATIVPAPGDIVVGMVYALVPEDEMRLDRNEGVPFAYVTESLKATVTWAGAALSQASNDGNRDGEEVELLVYVDHERVLESTPNEEYVWRMNMGIADALARGMTLEYVEKYLRPFIRAEAREKVEAIAVPRYLMPGPPPSLGRILTHRWFYAAIYCFPGSGMGMKK